MRERCWRRCQPVSRADIAKARPPGTKFYKSKGNIDSPLLYLYLRCLLRLEKAGHPAIAASNAANQSMLVPRKDVPWDSAGSTLGSGAECTVPSAVRHPPSTSSSATSTCSSPTCLKKGSPTASNGSFLSFTQVLLRIFRIKLLPTPLHRFSPRNQTSDGPRIPPSCPRLRRAPPPHHIQSFFAVSTRRSIMMISSSAKQGRWSARSVVSVAVAIILRLSERAGKKCKFSASPPSL